MQKIAIFILSLALAACGGNSDDDAVVAALIEEGVTGLALLQILSNRPDLISGGDVLVAVTLGSAEAETDLVMTLNGDDVTSVLQASADNPLRLLGTVTGLQLGENEIALNIGNSITLTNHPKGGPVFTGPQIQPWDCRNPDSADAQCNQAATYELLYRRTTPREDPLEPYNPDAPPNDVAMTTTTTGEQVPFIVRKETGYQARDQYVVLTLFNPDQEWTPAAPQPQWNRRMLVTHGGNCRGKHTTGSSRLADYAGTIPPNPGIPDSYITALGQGWAVLAASQLNLGHNCNLSNQAEALMMAKETFVEQYGELRYTVGTGCSGGAITQNMIANAYPGLYQGLLTTCTYPDVMSTATQFADYHILRKFFADEDRHGNEIFRESQQNAIYDHPNGVLNAQLADDELFGEAVNPESDCGIPEGVGADKRFDQVTNPGGARCDVLTFMQNILGARPMSVWSAMETALGRGFAGFPLGNEGVQYGLLPLQLGQITPAQFLQLNTKIGGLDSNLNVLPERLKPDYPALPNAFRSGILNTIVNMDTVPIINATGPDPGAAHDSVHGYWVRWRFDREFGHHDNHVMWGGPAPLIGDPNYMNQGLDAMAKWLEAIEADTSTAPLAQKIIANKPADVHDQCSNGSGQKVRDEMCTKQEMLVYGTPRRAAGDNSGDHADDTPGGYAGGYGDMAQCPLRDFSRDDNYGLGNIVWQDAEWNALEETFATGVCDYSEGKRPLEWQPTITWLTYQSGVGPAAQVITGGTQMEAADYPLGWASPAFSNTWEPGWQTE